MSEGLSDSGLVLESSVAPISVDVGREESADSYPRAVALLNARWRVIACRDDVQWILQTRSGQRWMNRYFFRSRAGLVRGCHEYAGQIAGDALVILLRLPNFFHSGEEKQ